MGYELKKKTSLACMLIKKEHFFFIGRYLHIFANHANQGCSVHSAYGERSERIPLACKDKRAIKEIYIQQGWKKAYTSETSPSSCVIHANP